MSKSNGKGKDKQGYIPKPKNPKPSAKENPAKNDTCHHYKEVGHSKRNCHVYLAELLKKKKQVGIANSSGKMTRKSFPHHLERATGLLGIKHTDLTPSYTPQHNGVFEKRNRTLLDMVRFMMNLTTMSLSFWDYALEKVPNLFYLKVWGCEALVKRDTPDKLQQRSVKCIFIGYPKETMGYYFYFPPENKFFVARYDEFFEKNLITQEVSGRAIDVEEIQD
nr:hypothetical protein [Tanacetum cinerariifolium]